MRINGRRSQVCVHMRVLQGLGEPEALRDEDGKSVEGRSGRGLSFLTSLIQSLKYATLVKMLGYIGCQQSRPQLASPTRTQALEP